MSARILILDIERQSALVDGVWQLGSRGSSWIHPDRIVEPSRTICFAYRWEDEDKTRFIAEWDGGLPQDNTSMAPGGGHYKMIQKAHSLFDEAHYIVGWNSKSFDIKHLRGHMFAYDLLPPSPHVDIDLMTASSRNFAFMAKSMAYMSKVKGTDGKLASGGSDTWRTLRFGQGDVLRRAQRKMKKYNIQDVDNTLDLYYEYRPWLTGLNLGLHTDDGELHCPNCAGTHLQYRGQAGNGTHKYRRFQCQSCGRWGRDIRSFAKVEVAGI